MPANVRFHVVLQGQLGQHKSFFGVTLRIDEESFHSLGVAMIWVLSKDLIRSLQAFSFY